uniref:RING-CH-type domain-containing protein n=1 Tax=Bovine herpesvirus 4 TaxID=10385 RepID=A0A0F6N4Z4_BHV4|nr:hypothetical protein pBo5 [Bovine gammaherpesvirus 4]
MASKDSDVRCVKCQSLKPTTPLTGQDRCARCVAINELKPWISTCNINPCYDGDLSESNETIEMMDINSCREDTHTPKNPTKGEIQYCPVEKCKDNTKDSSKGEINYCKVQKCKDIHRVENQSSIDEEGKQCWICRDGESLPEARYCNCYGDLQYCHEECLKTWISMSGEKKCKFCQTPYKVNRQLSLKRGLPGYWDRDDRFVFIAGFIGMGAILVGWIVSFFYLLVVLCVKSFTHQDVMIVVCGLVTIQVVGSMFFLFMYFQIGNLLRQYVNYMTEINIDPLRT